MRNVDVGVGGDKPEARKDTLGTAAAAAAAEARMAVAPPAESRPIPAVSGWEGFLAWSATKDPAWSAVRGAQ